MGFFFKNKKKNKEEETVTPVVETTPEVPAKDVSGNFTDRVDDHCGSVDNDRNIRTSWWIFEQNSVCDPWNSDRSRDRSSGSDGIWKSSRDHRI